MMWLWVHLYTSSDFDSSYVFSVYLVYGLYGSSECAWNMIVRGKYCSGRVGFPNIFMNLVTGYAWLASKCCKVRAHMDICYGF